MSRSSFYMPEASSKEEFDALELIQGLENQAFKDRLYFNNYEEYSKHNKFLQNAEVTTDLPPITYVFNDTNFAIPIDTWDKESSKDLPKSVKSLVFCNSDSLFLAMMKDRFPSHVEKITLQDSNVTNEDILRLKLLHKVKVELINCRNITKFAKEELETPYSLALQERISAIEDFLHNAKEKFASHDAIKLLSTSPNPEDKEKLEILESETKKLSEITQDTWNKIIENAEKDLDFLKQQRDSFLDRQKTELQKKEEELRLADPFEYASQKAEYQKSRKWQRLLDALDNSDTMLSPIKKFHNSSELPIEDQESLGKIQQSIENMYDGFFSKGSRRSFADQSNSLCVKVEATPEGVAKFTFSNRSEKPRDSWYPNKESWINSQREEYHSYRKAFPKMPRPAIKGHYVLEFNYLKLKPEEDLGVFPECVSAMSFNNADDLLQAMQDKLPPNITEIIISDSRVIEIDMRKFPHVKKLTIHNCPNLETLDLGNITELYLGDSKKNITITGGEKLENLELHVKKKEIDLSLMTSLRTLKIGHSINAYLAELKLPLTKIKLPKNLRSLTIGDNCTKLKKLEGLDDLPELRECNFGTGSKISQDDINKITSRLANIQKKVQQEAIILKEIEEIKNFIIAAEDGFAGYLRHIVQTRELFYHKERQDCKIELPDFQLFEFLNTEKLVENSKKHLASLEAKLQETLESKNPKRSSAALDSPPFKSLDHRYSGAPTAFDHNPITPTPVNRKPKYSDSYLEIADLDPVAITALDRTPKKEQAVLENTELAAIENHPYLKISNSNPLPTSQISSEEYSDILIKSTQQSLNIVVKESETANTAEDDEKAVEDLLARAPEVISVEPGTKVTPKKTVEVKTKPRPPRGIIGQ